MHRPIPLDIVRLIVDNLDDRHRWRNLPSKERLVKLEEWRRVGWALALSCRELNELGTRMVWRSVRATSKNALAVVAALASSEFLRSCVEEIDFQIRNSGRKDGAIMRFLRSIFEADPATSLFSALPTLPRLRYLSFSANTDEVRQNWGPIGLTPRLSLTHVALSFDAPFTDHEPFFLRTVFTSIEVASLRSLDLTVDGEAAQSAILAFLPSCINLEVLLLTLGHPAGFHFFDGFPRTFQGSLPKLQYLSCTLRSTGIYTINPLFRLIPSLPLSLVAFHLHNSTGLSQASREISSALEEREPSDLEVFTWVDGTFREHGIVKETIRWDGSSRWEYQDGEGLFEEMLRRRSSP